MAYTVLHGTNFLIRSLGRGMSCFLSLKMKEKIRVIAAYVCSSLPCFLRLSDTKMKIK